MLSGATVALVVGKTASKVRVEDAAAYIAGYALANEVSLPEELLPPGHQGQMPGRILPAWRTGRR